MRPKTDTHRKFQVNFFTTPDQPLRLSSVKADQLVGKMAAIAAAVPTYSDSKLQSRSDAGGLEKRAGEATPLAIKLFSRAGVDLKVFEYGNEDLIQGELAVSIKPFFPACAPKLLELMGTCQQFDIAIPRTFGVRRGSNGGVTIVDE